MAKEPGIIAFFPKQYLLEKGSGKGTAGREDHIRGVLRRDEMVSDLDTGPYIRIDSFVVGHITGQYRRNRTFTSFRNCGCHLHGGNSEQADTRPLETDHRTARGHSVCRLWFLRLGGHRAAHTEEHSTCLSAKRLCRQRGPGDHGAPNDYHRCGRCHADNAPRHEGGKPRLGCDQWQTIYKVIIPYSISGITSAVVLGIGRAIGETMAVLMVTGNAAVIPTSFFEPVRTIPATIAAELGEAPAGGAHYEALFLLGAVLFLITLILSISVEYISSKRKI